jgi:DnaJ-domain-containing protein 1
MKLIPGNKSRFQQDREVMMLDDAEMALALIDLSQTTKLKDHPRAPAAPFQSDELLTELYSAASMIMDREECEALVREIEQAQRKRAIHKRKPTVAA